MPGQGCGGSPCCGFLSRPRPFAKFQASAMELFGREENFGNLTAGSFLRLSPDTRVYLKEVEAGGAPGNASDCANWTRDAGNLTGLSSSEGSAASPEKNWPALLTVTVIVVTIAGNILVIMAVSLEKKLQNATNYFLMSLAVADILLGFLVMPVSMLNILYGISMPVPVFGLQDDSKVFNQENCSLSDENFILVGSFVAFFIPLIIMVVTYFLTIKSLQKEATLCFHNLGAKSKLALFSFLPQSSLSSEKLFQRSLQKELAPYGRRTMQSISNEQKASKVLGIVFFLFVVMWCPFFITNVMAVICKESCNEHIMGELLKVFVWIGYLSSAVNPLVYTLFNKTYRSAFSRYIQCRYKEEKKPLQLILVNTIPALAYKSSQLQLAQMKSLKKEARMMGKDYSMVTIGIHHLDNTSNASISPVNEKVSCV
ncbi:5-hydroxytryptamine receptor 2A isoform X2 [Rhinatrema bivittatum]|uniref:5-hydroxytryptamine receptor 2A isoform X2 n=1 Tax=Rhinatrema bivittatum TaxID=194408 RepID=UPI001127067F|nr:5-hydroxytryptamine receptor 2A isoform X2 [Rhinatrema bivittatum]